MSIAWQTVRLLYSMTHVSYTGHLVECVGVFALAAMMLNLNLRAIAFKHDMQAIFPEIITAMPRDNAANQHFNDVSSFLRGLSRLTANIADTWPHLELVLEAYLPPIPADDDVDDETSVNENRQVALYRWVSSYGMHVYMPSQVCVYVQSTVTAYCRVYMYALLKHSPSMLLFASVLYDMSQVPDCWQRAHQVLPDDQPGCTRLWSSQGKQCILVSVEGSPMCSC